jgi:hypothetical protein
MSRDRQGIRVNLTLPPELVAVLDKLTAVTGVSRAGFIREILMEGLPQFALMVQSLELAKKKNVDAYKSIRAAIDSTRAQADQISMDLKTADRKHRRLVRLKAKTK